MPPAISEDEASASESEIPFEEVEKPASAPAEDEDDEDDEDEDDEEYVVEKIVSHLFEPDGEVKYEVKWLGYERKEDRTWEPEENLKGAMDVLQEYWDKIGGRPVFEPKPKKRKRSQGLTSTPEPKGSTRRGNTKPKQGSATSAKKPAVHKKEGEWTLPMGSWEDHVSMIDTIEEEPDPKTGKKERYAFVLWNDSKKSRHNIRVLNQKCPQKMLAYYEQHLYFKK